LWNFIRKHGIFEKYYRTAFRMKYEVTHFKSLTVAIKELQPFILNGHHLQNGKGFALMNDMRSREMLGNLLLCISVNSSTSPGRMIFTSAPDDVGGDGIIYDRVAEMGIPTEHVMVPAISRNAGRNAGELILEAVRLKVKKGGSAYASGKTLVVFLFQSTGEWYPNKVTPQLPDPLLFEAVWVVCLHGVEEGRYTYNVTRLAHPHAPAWRVRFNKNFDGWEVEAVQ
jgi:hypothetical protein